MGRFRDQLLALAQEYEELELRCEVLEERLGSCAAEEEEEVASWTSSVPGEYGAGSIGLLAARSPRQSRVAGSTGSSPRYAEYLPKVLPKGVKVVDKSGRLGFNNEEDNEDTGDRVPQDRQPSRPSKRAGEEGSKSNFTITFSQPVSTVTTLRSIPPAQGSVGSPSPSRPNNNNSHNNNGSAYTSGQTNSAPLTLPMVSVDTSVFSAAEPRVAGRLSIGSSPCLGILPEDRMSSGGVQNRREMMYSLGSENGSVAKIPVGMLSPVGTSRLSWDALAAAIMIVDIWATLFEIVYLFETNVDFLNALNWAIVAFFALDIVLNFCTGFIADDKIVLDRRPSMMMYLRGFFLLDLVATVPFDILISGVSDAGTAVSLLRVSKVARVLRTLRFLRMMRAHQTLQQAQSRRAEVEDVLSASVKLLQLVGLGLLLAHIDACIRGFLQFQIGHVQRKKDLTVALEQYWDNFVWAFHGLSSGLTPGLGAMGVDGYDELDAESDSRIRAFSLVVAAQRLGLQALLALWAVRTGSRFFHHRDGFRIQRAGTLQYLQKRKVSLEMQLQIVSFMNRAHKAQVMQKSFQNFTSQHWPEELRRAVCEELWVAKLLSLGLILHIHSWHFDMLTRLSMIVHEDVFAVKMVLCRESTPSIAAYYIIKGKFDSIGQATALPPFTDGMWVAERALVKPFIMHRMSLRSLSLSCTMTIPAEKFQKVLAELAPDLTQRFQVLCKDYASKGLCGRCGALGEHFVHQCPTLRPYRLLQPSKKSRYWPSRLRKLWSMASMHSEEKPVGARRRPLRMATQEIHNLSQLEAQEIQQAAIDGPEATEHLIFLSHYKAEAGTEATLLQQEIMHMFAEESFALGSFFDEPVFLDSESLSDLDDLQQRVRKTHNLLFLLTKSVLSRPWVILELCTAVDAGVRIIPVLLVKGEQFEVPDEDCYTEFLAGGMLGQTGQELLQRHGYDLEIATAYLRRVFLRIAMPYSPHRAAAIRRAELTAILKRCALRTDPSGEAPLRVQSLV